MFKFACGRWLGTSVDDGSCERYLVGYQVGGGQASNNESSSPKDSNSMAQVISSCTRSPARPMPPPSNRGIKTVTDSEEEVVVELQVNGIKPFIRRSLNLDAEFVFKMLVYVIVHALHQERFKNIALILGDKKNHYNELLVVAAISLCI